MRRIQHRLKDRGLSIKMFNSSNASEARLLSARAHAESFDMVICAGGDGTIHEVVNGMAESNLILGILPMGTGNVLACELGIPLNPLEACRVLSDGVVRKIDLCKADEIYFTCMAGVGFDAQVVKELDPKVKELLGRIAYPLSGLRTLMRYGLPELRIEIDGQKAPMTGHAVVVCNSRRYGGRFRLCPEAVIDDGWMDVCILQKRDAFAILRSGLAILFNSHERVRGVNFYRAKSLHITSDKNVLVQSDGDVVGTTPVRFSIIPGAISVMAPRNKRRDAKTF